MADECGELADILERAKAELAPLIAEAVTMCDWAAVVKALDDFISSIRAALSYERTRGRLKPHSPFDEVFSWKTQFSERGWGAAAKNTFVESLLQPGEWISAVDWFVVTLTSGRTITRADVRAACREVLLSELESDEKVNKLREAATEKAAKEAHAARLTGTGITDRNGVFRDFGERA